MRHISDFILLHVHNYNICCSFNLFIAGMESIAQETVEFLYEENGGIPKDLRLPTMDDVKAELGKFTISRIRKGSAVVVQKELPCLRCGVRAMQKTQGLTGIVLDVDHVSGVWD